MTNINPFGGGETHKKKITKSYEISDTEGQHIPAINLSSGYNLLSDRAWVRIPGHAHNAAAGRYYERTGALQQILTAPHLHEVGKMHIPRSISIPLHGTCPCKVVS